MPAPIIHVWSWGDDVGGGAPTASWTSVLLRDSLRNARMLLLGGLMIFRKVLGTLALLILAPLLAEGQTKTTITGNIQDVTGIAATSGTIEFKIKPSSSSILYFVSGVGVIAPQVANCGIDSSGDIKNLALTGACQVWGNDLISPGNTTYDVSFLPNGTRTNRIRSLLIEGTTYNLANPTFAPNVKLSPQRVTVRAGRVEANLVPAADGIYNLGANDKRYASAYLDSLFVTNDLTFTDLNVTGVVGSNLIPDATGRDLGSSSARWDASLEVVTIGDLNNIPVVDGNKYAQTVAGINSALGDLPAGGGIVDARPIEGAFTFDGDITIPANTTLLLGATTFSGTGRILVNHNSGLIGLCGNEDNSGDGTTILSYTGTGSAIIPETSASLTYSVHLECLTIVGTSSGGIGIDALNARWWAVTDVRVRTFTAGQCVRVRGTTTSGHFNRFTRLHTSNCDTEFLVNNDATANRSNRGSCTDCLFLGGGVNGVDLDGDTWKFSNSSWQEHTGISLRFRDDSDNSTFTNSTLENSTAGSSTGVQIDAGAVQIWIHGGSIGGYNTLGTDAGTRSDLAITGMDRTIRSGQLDGIKILSGDGSPISMETPAGFIYVPQTFASLGTPTNGVHLYCSDCLKTNPCASGGDGAFAQRLNGLWFCGGTELLEGALSNAPRWIFKQVDHTDMTAAATAATFTLWTLPANTMIHDLVGTVVSAWAGSGPVSAAVCSVGTQAGSANDLTLDDNFFSASRVYELHDATANGGKGTLLFDTTDKFAPRFFFAGGVVEIQCDLTGGDHADTSAGQARIYILVSQPLGNTTIEAN